jgi:HlyD family secretion protein
MKKFFYLLILVFIVTISYFSLTEFNKKNSPNKKKEHKIISPEKGDIITNVSCTGKIVSNLDVLIKCKASGEIIKLPVDISDTVEENSLLCELDPEDEIRNLKQAKVKLLSSKAQLSQAKLKYTRQKELLENKIIQKKAEIIVAKADVEDKRKKAERLKRLYKKQNTSLESLEEAILASLKAKNSLEIQTSELMDLQSQTDALDIYKDDITLAESQVESNQISLETAQERLAETKVYAPSRGVISELNVQKGLIVSSPTSNVSGGTTLMTLSDLSRIFVLASVDESDIGQIKKNQAVNIKVDAYQGKKFKGIVSRIATQGTNSSNVVTFEVKIEVISTDKHLLLPEMTANIEIITHKAENVLYVPETAVISRRGKKFVYLYSPDTINNPYNQNNPDLNKKPDRKIKRNKTGNPEKSKKEVSIPGLRKLVETGLSDGLNIEIKSGLELTDKIIDSPEQDSQKWIKKERSSGFRIPGMGRRPR